MPVMFGFKQLAALPQERVTDKISRRVLAGWDLLRMDTPVWALPGLARPVLA